MTTQRPNEAAERLAKVLFNLRKRDRPDGPCWCVVGPNRVFLEHESDCVAARAALAAERAAGHQHEWKREYAPNYRQASEADDWRDECACGAFRTSGDAERAAGIDVGLVTGWLREMAVEHEADPPGIDYVTVQIPMFTWDGMRAWLAAQSEEPA